MVAGHSVWIAGDGKHVNLNKILITKSLFRKSLKYIFLFISLILILTTLILFSIQLQ